MQSALYLLIGHTEYPPLFVTAANALDAVDLYRDHYEIGAYGADALEIIVEVHKVPVVATAPMVHPWNYSTLTGALRLEPYDRFAITFETAYRVPVLTGEEVPF